MDPQGTPLPQTPRWAANYPLTQGFGPTDEKLDSSYGGYEHFNVGLDFGMPIGTNITSPISGVVVATNDNPDDSLGWGRYVWIRDENGNVHRFGHLSYTGNLTLGQSVTKGDIIGRSGDTGKSTGPHLSYDVSNSQGKYIDPAGFLVMPIGLQAGDWPGNGDTTSSWQDELKTQRDELMGQAAEYIARGEPVPNDLQKQIDSLNLLELAGLGVTQDQTSGSTPERDWATKLNAYANLLGAGVSLGGLKADSAAAKLKAYNDQYEAGLVSPTGYKYDQTPGSFLRSQIGLVDQNDAAYLTKQMEPPGPDSITQGSEGGYQDALNWLLSQVGAYPGSGSVADQPAATPSTTPDTTQAWNTPEMPPPDFYGGGGGGSAGTLGGGGIDAQGALNTSLYSPPPEPPGRVGGIINNMMGYVNQGTDALGSVVGYGLENMIPGVTTYNKARLGAQGINSLLNQVPVPGWFPQIPQAPGLPNPIDELRKRLPF